MCPTAGCSSGKDGIDAPDSPTPQIIVMYAPGGLGDQGYNDCILTGVQNFKKNNYEKADIYQYSPNSIEEAERLLTDWLSLAESEIPALFVVASSDYEPMVNICMRRNRLTHNKRMLLFESDNETGLPITTFRISMYGASYLAGCTAATYIAERHTSGSSKDALIVLAHEGDDVITPAKDGFIDGYKAVMPGGDVTLEYLADDWSGYISAPETYRNMKDWATIYDFIFPVAGGSNQGIYRFTREQSTTLLTAGMDIDQSSLSKNICGSVIKRIDLILYNYLDTWLNTGELPASQTFGLKGGYTDWLLSPNYIKYTDIVGKMRHIAEKAEEENL